jgi:hypothetical protein
MGNTATRGMDVRAARQVVGAFPTIERSERDEIDKWPELVCERKQDMDEGGDRLGVMDDDVKGVSCFAARQTRLGMCR